MVLCTKNCSCELFEKTALVKIDHSENWGNLILHQKTNENDKNTKFMIKKNNKMSEMYMKALSNIFIMNSTH